MIGKRKRKDPWTDPDPQPGDFDDDLALMGPDDIQVVEAGSGAEVVYVETDDINGWLRRRREGLAAARQPLQ